MRKIVQQDPGVHNVGLQHQLRRLAQVGQRGHTGGALTAPPEPYLLARAVLADMRASGWGRIVNVSTGLVEDGFPGNVSYVAAKAGLHGLTRVMSRELASAGILTNVVMPGFTPADKAMPQHLLDKAGEAAATKRVSHPGEAARMIVYLCSAANTNTTGEAIRTDGHFLTPA
ncbi:SDR family NAD(P)-dependent oxidoreductase [Streptosporangium sp. NPDC002721]|uniref:SDR family NAD(P)-dependent oxidoreductase n=1 Tax=Streptosporangium sp. NPDC002721 TaxID=3366188 RepID=UPI0036810BC6